MKNTFILFIFAVISINVNAQDYSTFRVKYMVTYDNNKDVFTAWVVPGYNTPNYNNGDGEEKGATAQFTLKVPKDFEISQINDVKGSWEKKPIKIDGPSISKYRTSVNYISSNERTIDSKFAYYIIGKTVVETNYGQFIENEPVALFTFKGKSSAPNEVASLEIDNPFIKFADETLSLNIGNSFYSRSGQKPTVSAVPLEQFEAPINLQKVVEKTVSNLGIENSSENEINKVIVYPNPANDFINLKYFSDQDNVLTSLEVVDLKGNLLINQNLTTKLGFNNVKLNISSLQPGLFFIKTIQGNRINTNKIIKIYE